MTTTATAGYSIDCALCPSICRGVEWYTHIQCYTAEYSPAPGPSGSGEALSAPFSPSGISAEIRVLKFYTLNSWIAINVGELSGAIFCIQEKTKVFLPSPCCPLLLFSFWKSSLDI